MDIHTQRIGGGTGLSGSNHRLIDVPPEHVIHVKDQIAHWIDEVSAENNYYTSQDVWSAIEKREAQLWLVWDEVPEAVFVTELVITSQGKHCRVWLLAGRNAAQWIHLTAELEAWAKREGCSFMRHEGRQGWSKMLKAQGYHSSQIIYEKDL